MDKHLTKKLIIAQRNEITEHAVYRRIARHEKDPENRRILNSIADEEKKHYDFWAKYTNKQPGPYKFRIFKYTLIAKFLGVIFAVRLMETSEQRTQHHYLPLVKEIPESQPIVDDEHNHEDQLIRILDGKRIIYAGSVVLGLNDALVELTGVLAGLTLAFRDSNIIAVSGLITGIAAALSMAASEYLSTRSEEFPQKSPIRSALYTGLAYICTVMILILPFLLLDTPIISLVFTVSAAILIIFGFSFFISVAKGLSFKKRFTEMAVLSLGITAISFVIGYIVRLIFGVDI